MIIFFKSSSLEWKIKNSAFVNQLQVINPSMCPVCLIRDKQHDDYIHGLMGLMPGATV